MKSLLVVLIIFGNVAVKNKNMSQYLPFGIDPEWNQKEINDFIFGLDENEELKTFIEKLNKFKRNFK